MIDDVGDVRRSEVEISVRYALISHRRADPLEQWRQGENGSGHHCSGGTHLPESACGCSDNFAVAVGHGMGQERCGGFGKPSKVAFEGSRGRPKALNTEIKEQLVRMICKDLGLLPP